MSPSLKNNKNMNEYVEKILVEHGSEEEIKNLEYDFVVFNDDLFIEIMSYIKKPKDVISFFLVKKMKKNNKSHNILVKSLRSTFFSKEELRDAIEEYMESDDVSDKYAIGDWDVSNVTDMSGLFSGIEGFNEPIGDWDVSNVTNMTRMFFRVESFNQPIGNWNVSNVTNMSRMFFRVESFNQPIGNWNVSNVTNMSRMFFGAKSFNQPINHWNGHWNVSNVTNMSGMFFGAESFNQPIGNWNVSNVTNMEGMFSNTGNFNLIIILILIIVIIVISITFYWLIFQLTIPYHKLLVNIL